MKTFILIITLLLSALQSAISGQYNAILEIGDPMPTFVNLPGINDQSLSASELGESVLVFVLLANHCPWVRGMDQDLIRLVKSFHGQNVRIIGVSFNHLEQDRLDGMKAHAEKVGYNFDYIFDESQEFGRKLGATRTPEYFVFNQERKLVYMGLLHNSPGKMGKDGKVKYINGEPDEFYVQNAIANTLQQKPVSPAETRAHGCTIKYIQ